MENNFLNRGQSLIGAIIILIIVGVITGGLYYYFSEQIPDVSEITEKTTEEKGAEESSKISDEEKPEITKPEVICQNECSPIYSKQCASEKSFQVCGYYDEDECLEWGPAINCPANNICQNGNCVKSEEVAPQPQPQPPIVKKCADGTLYNQCSTNKPKYCEGGDLIEKASLCGCPAGYESYGDKCIKMLSEECGIIYEGSKNYEKAVNFVIVPADLLYGSYLNNPEAQYSDNLDIFITDARKNVNDFLSVDPMNRYKNIFNFYFSTHVIDCTTSGGYVRCDLWKEAADKCNIPYDHVIVLQRKEGGGLGGIYIQSSALSSVTFVHEIGHYFGLRDYDYLALPVGPNHCTNLDCCGGVVCQFEHWSYQKPIELGGPNCCLYIGELENTSFYIPNEQSVMHQGTGGDYNALKFNHLERDYLNELFSQIMSVGKEAVRCGEHRLKLKKYCKPITASQ